MRKTWFLLLLAPSAMVWACGGDDSGTDGGTDAQGDTTVKNDSGTDAGSDTGTDGSSVLDTGSNDSGSNTDAFSILCQFPSDCVEGGVPDGSYPPAEAGVVCCGTLKLSGTAPNCNFDSLSTTCAAPSACASSIQLTCTTDTVRGCEHNSECTEPQYNKCCNFKGFADGGANICSSAQIAQLAGATCMP